jgi:hypothetical protein
MNPARGEPLATDRAPDEAQLAVSGENADDRTPI